ncbi:MAG: PD-(D/E)XK nuclease family protein [bacterium]
MNNKKVIIGSYSAGLEEALFSYITSNHNGIEPLYIIVPNNLCGLYLSHKLANEIMPYSNIKFLQIIDIAKKLTIKTLAEKKLKEKPLLLDQVLILEVIKTLDKDSYFSKVVNLSGFPSALLETFIDISQAGIDRFEFEERDIKTFYFSVKKLKELSRLYNKFREFRDTYKFYDSDYIIKLACQCENLIEELESNKIAIYGIYDLNYIQWKFIKTLSNQLNITMFFPYKDEIEKELTSEDMLPTDGISRYANNTLKLLLKEGFKIERVRCIPRKTILMEFQSKWFTGDKITSKPQVKILSCFIPLKEAEEITRRIIGLIKKGIHCSEIAIITMPGKKYTKLIISSLKKSGIPYYTQETEPYYSNSVLRSTALLINLINSNLPRQDTIDFLQYAKIPYKEIIGKEHVKDALFDKISIKAGVIEGKDNWLENLDVYIKKLETQYEEETSKYIEAQKETTRDLRAIIQHLSDDVYSFPNEASISEYLQLIVKIIKKYIQNEHKLGIVNLIETEIGKLEFLNLKIRWRDFKKLALLIIESISEDKDNKSRNGVNVLSPMMSRGIKYRVVFIPGLSENVFPSKGNQDSILLDFEREEINKKIDGFLPLKSERSIEDLQLLALAIDSATDKIYITFPRYESIEGDDTFPSYYLSTMLQSLIGRKPSYSELQTGEGLPEDFFEIIPYKTTERDEFTTIEEYDLTTLTSAYYKRDIKKIANILDEELFPFIRKGIEQRIMMFSDDFNKYSGLIESKEVKNNIYEQFVSNGLSATLLQDYSTCPYQFLLNRILNIKTIREPAVIIKLEPLDIGNLVHRILHHSYEKIKREKGIKSLRELEDYMGIVKEITVCEYKDFINTFPEEYRFLIEQEILLLSTLIENAVRSDASEEEEWELIHLETSFGRPCIYSENILTEEPLRKELDENLIISISGKVDRVDVNEDKKVIRLIDYKITTNKEKYNIEKMVFPNGLQALFYTLFSKEHFKDYKEHIFQYRVLSRKDNMIYPFEITLEEIEEVSLDVFNNLKDIVKNLSEGIFIPFANDNCPYCDYSIICPLKSKIIMRKKTENNKKYSEIEQLFNMKIFGSKNEVDE